MTPKSALTEAVFRERLQELGLTLDDRAFAAAWAGAQQLRAGLDRINAYLARSE